MVQIDVTGAGDEYVVVVDDGAGTTRHQVTARPDAVAEYGGGKPAREVVREAFEFLLAREPKDAILARFDLRDIALHMPDYPNEGAAREM